MIERVTMEVGTRYSTERARAQVRIAIDGERRGKLSLTLGEAKRLAKALELGCARLPTPMLFVLIAADGGA